MAEASWAVLPATTFSANTVARDIGPGLRAPTYEAYGAVGARGPSDRIRFASRGASTGGNALRKIERP